jgi:hypothetical protein
LAPQRPDYSLHVAHPVRGPHALPSVHIGI